MNIPDYPWPKCVSAYRVHSESIHIVDCTIITSIQLHLFCPRAISMLLHILLCLVSFKTEDYQNMLPDRLYCRLFYRPFVKGLRFISINAKFFKIFRISFCQQLPARLRVLIVTLHQKFGICVVDIAPSPGLKNAVAR